jgi:hypothetical protein
VPHLRFRSETFSQDTHLVAVRIFLSCVLLLRVAPISAQSAADPPATANSNAVVEREISWKKILPNFLDDQKKIWSFPAQVARARRGISGLMKALFTGLIRGFPGLGPLRESSRSPRLSTL